MPSGVPRIPEPWEWVRTKRCSRCGKEKPWAQFPPRKYWPEGGVRFVAAHCHDCDSALSRERQRQYRRENRYREYKVAWRRRKRAALRRDRGQRDSMSLPVGPLLAWLEERADDLGGLSAVAASCGTNERNLRRIRSQETVSLSFVDRCCVALGFHVNDVYPPEEDA